MARSRDARSAGSGLGLSIARTITATNRPGGGTEFAIRLPIEPDPG